MTVLRCLKWSASEMHAYWHIHVVLVLLHADLDRGLARAMLSVQVS